MTVSYENSYIEYFATASQTDFTIPFGYLASTHIHVYNSDGGFSGAPEFVQGSDYSVVGGGSPKVVFGVGRTAGDRILIRRITPKTQETDYPEGGGRFEARSHEAALDKLTWIAQELSNSPTLGDFDFADFMQVISDGTFDSQGRRISNGAAAVDGSDYTTLDDVTALVAGGVTVELASGSLYSTTGDGQDEYETDWQGIDENDIIVFVEGQWQDPTSAYTIDNTGNPLTGSTIVFSENIASGAKIRAWAPSGSVVSTLSGIVVTDANISDDSIATAKLAASDEGDFLQVVSGEWTGAPLTASLVTDLASWIGTNVKLNDLDGPDGSVDFNNHKATGLAAGTASTDAVRVDQLADYPRSKSDTRSMSGSSGSSSRSCSMTFPWNVSMVTMSGSGALSAAFAFHGNASRIAYVMSGSTNMYKVTCERSASGSNKVVTVTVEQYVGTPTISDNLDICGVEGDA